MASVGLRRWRGRVCDQPRLIFGAALVTALAGLLAVVTYDGAGHVLSVVGGSPSYDPTAPLGLVPTAGEADESTATASTIPPRTNVPAGTTTTTRPSATDTRTTTPGAIVPSEDEDVVGPGPHDLLRRVAYLQEDSFTASSLWSMRPDGTDRRREVTCPQPDVDVPAVPPRDYGVQIQPFDLSPDGTHVVRSCMVSAPDPNGAAPYGEFALIVQDVDGAGVQVLWRYNLRDTRAYPSWSPDGRQIAVWTPQGIEVVHPDGTSRRRVTPSSTILGQFLRWSPDGTHLVTNVLEIIDLATGRVDRPMSYGAPWPYSGGFSVQSIIEWNEAGIWFTGEFAPISASYLMSDTWGLYHLDPATGVATQVTHFAASYSQVERIGDEFVGLDPRYTYVRIRPDGSVHTLSDVAPVFLAVADQS